MWHKHFGGKVFPEILSMTEYGMNIAHTKEIFIVFEVDFSPETG